MRSVKVSNIIVCKRCWILLAPTKPVIDLVIALPIWGIKVIQKIVKPNNHVLTSLSIYFLLKPKYSSREQ